MSDILDVAHESHKWSYHKSRVDKLVRDRERLVAMGCPKPEPEDTPEDVQRIKDVYALRVEELRLLRRYVAEGYQLFDE